VQVDDDVLVEVGMGVGPVGFSTEQQDQLWEMWRGGESIRAIERAMVVSMPRAASVGRCPPASPAAPGVPSGRR